jgi:hypothetical protein
MSPHVVIAAESFSESESLRWRLNLYLIAPLHTLYVSCILFHPFSLTVIVLRCDSSTADNVNNQFLLGTSIVYLSLPPGIFHYLLSRHTTNIRPNCSLIQVDEESFFHPHCFISGASRLKYVKEFYFSSRANHLLKDSTHVRPGHVGPH